MTQPHLKTGPRAPAPDFRLVLRMLEQKILKGDSPDQCRRILGRADIRQKLTPDQQTTWARLAQMAGALDTALAVLAGLNRTHPDRADAWRTRLDILSLLDRPQERARVAEAYRRAGGPPPAPSEKDPAPSPPAGNADLEAAAEPFAERRRREAALSRYRALFAGREDCFARQWADKTGSKQGYAPVHRSMTLQDVADHIAGRRTYGIYLLMTDGRVRTGVLDADLVQDYRGRRLTAADKQVIGREQTFLFSRVRELSESQGVAPLLEFSGGKGYHFWYFFDPPVAAGRAKALLETIRDGVAGDLSAFGLEVFPKQDRLSGKGFGNLVKLPLGVHRLSGKTSYFVDCKTRSAEAQLACLAKVRPADPEHIQWAENPPPAEVVAHPTLKKTGGDFPELTALAAACTPLARVVSICRSGKEITQREEKVLLQTLGFLPNAKPLIHHLMAGQPDYNPHLVDYKLSRVRGTPLGCRRIHTLTGYEGPMCGFEPGGGYGHPLRHLGHGAGEPPPKSEKVEHLSAALGNLKLAIAQVERFLR